MTYKVTAILSFLACFVAAYYFDWYWSNVCAVEGCGAGYINSFLAPALKASVSLALLLLCLILFPSHYFKSWLRKIAWWLLPISALIVYETPAHGHMLWYDREDAVVILGFVVGFITLLFVAFHWFKNRRKHID